MRTFIFKPHPSPKDANSSTNPKICGISSLSTSAAASHLSSLSIFYSSPPSSPPPSSNASKGASVTVILDYATQSPRTAITGAVDQPISGSCCCCLS
ncbi:hypothetical protein Dimus_025638 [Dionaea muscipula]